MVYGMFEPVVGGLQAVVGAKVNRIAMDEDTLVFDTDKGLFAFTVSGDCCSCSYFYDFYGVDKLLENGPVTAVGEIELDQSEVVQRECTVAYGFQLITENDKWGEQTSVFSFRNDSNGYYGGWMEPLPTDSPHQDWKRFFELHELVHDTTLD
jgi:hypothetical protein